MSRKDRALWLKMVYDERGEGSSDNTSNTKEMTSLPSSDLMLLWAYQNTKNIIFHYNHMQRWDISSNVMGII